ncbi:Tyrosine-protein phosphatase non-receptor type 9 [Podila horticola]|nr:Tyrosine-protein phosphatase non-receptor type 9 [Podila horticola]
MSRLPGFLRLDSAITARAAVEAQHQLFAHLNRMERQRAQAAFAPSSPFSVISAPAKLRSSLPDNWRGYIATQAPLPQTQSRFWRMILEQNVHVIVCLTAVSPERSRRAQKAECYWPLVGETDEFEKDIKVRNLETTNHSDEIVAYHQFEDIHI